MSFKMASTNQPVRVLQSGKVYRQIFDAEVQLMRTFDAKRKSKADTSVAAQSGKKEMSFLPDINAGKFRPATSTGEEPARSAAVNDSMLNDRQRSWKDGVPNDSVTENPVYYRQLTTEAAARVRESESNLNAREVRGLPDVVRPAKLDSDVNERIAQRRKERHDKQMEQMHREMAQVSNEMEPRVQSIGDDLTQKLADDDKQIEAVFGQLASDVDLQQLTHEQLEVVWQQIEAHTPSRRGWIRSAYEWFNQCEDERLQKITGILHEYSTQLEKTASIPPAETYRMIEQQAMMINQSVLANRRAYAQLNTNLLESDIEREILQHQEWEEKVKDWKKLKAEAAVQQFIEYMQSEMMVNPVDANELLETLLEEQSELVRARTEILEQLRQLKPPTSTKPSVYKWNTTLTHAQKAIEKLHVRLVRALHEKYELSCQSSLTQIEKYKQELLESKVCGEDDMRRIVNEHLLPLVGNRLRSFETKLEAIDRHFEALARRTETQLRNVFKFAQGVAHVWDVHEINLARDERTLEAGLEQGRLVHDAENQEREGKLDVMLDRLRQECSDDALSSCLDNCLQMLLNIKRGYQQFHEEQCAKVTQFPELMTQQVASYEDSVCAYFSVRRDEPGSEEEAEREAERRRGESPQPEPSSTRDDSRAVQQKSSQQDRVDQLESAVKKVVKEILVTKQGTNFYLMTEADRDDFEDDEQTEQRQDVFLTEVIGEESKEVPNYLKNVIIETSYLRELKKHVRIVFLTHLEEWKVAAMSKAGAAVQSKKEELSCELDLRLHLHAPRAARIRSDIRDVRAEELVVHRERVERHCKGVSASLMMIRQDSSELLERFDVEVKLFRAEMEGSEGAYAAAAKSDKLEKLNERLHENLDAFTAKLTQMMTHFRSELADRIATLKQSNLCCLDSFELFADGGNFSPEEVAPLRRKVEKSQQRVDTVDQQVRTDVDGVAEKRCQDARDLVGKFEDRLRHHVTDLSFVESVQRWLRHSQTRVKTEVAFSNGMALEVARHMAALRSRVDACERPNIDKEHVTVEMLARYMCEVMECVHRRADYLNCKKPTRRPTLDQLESRASISHSGADLTSAHQRPRADSVTHATALPLSAVPAPPPATAPARTRVESGKGKKAPPTGGGGGETAGGVSRRETRTSVGIGEDPAIGLIKNILRAQKGGSGSWDAMEDTRSIATGTTARVVPSTSHTQMTSRGGGGGGGKKGGKLASIAASDSSAEGSRKKPGVASRAGSSTTYRRRDTKFDPKYMAFGIKPPEGNHFLAKTCAIMWDTLDGILSTAEVYYKQKGTRSTTRPHLMQETFDLCSEKIIEKLQGYEEQCKLLHNQSLQEFRAALRQLERDACDVPRLVIDDVINRGLESLEQQLNDAEREYVNGQSTCEQDKATHQHQLRPRLGHPDQADALNKLSQAEAQRQDTQVATIVSHATSQRATAGRCARDFLLHLLRSSDSLLRSFENLLTVDDVMVGDVPPLKEPTAELLRRRAEGVSMQDVADPSYGVVPLVERGPRKWTPAPLDGITLTTTSTGEGDDVIVTAGDDDVFSGIESEAPATTNATLPQTRAVAARDAALRSYVAAQQRRLADVEKLREWRETEERRWKANWEESVDNVKKLYR